MLASLRRWKKPKSKQMPRKQTTLRNQSEVVVFWSITCPGNGFSSLSVFTVLIFGSETSQLPIWKKSSATTGWSRRWSCEKINSDSVKAQQEFRFKTKMKLRGRCCSWTVAKSMEANSRCPSSLWTTSRRRRLSTTPSNDRRMRAKRVIATGKRAADVLTTVDGEEVRKAEVATVETGRIRDGIAQAIALDVEDQDLEIRVIGTVLDVR